VSVSNAFANGGPPDANRTFAYEGDSFTKEERDVAFAVGVLSGGQVSERQFQTALANWTIHGDTPLADQLQSLGLVTRNDRDRFEAAAVALLAGLNDGRPTGRSSLGATVEWIDRSGRVAKLLGIAGGDGAGQGGVRSSLARLTLVRKLGQGGLGTVWLARDENLQRSVALKEITRGEETSGPAVARFRREAEITGRLEHPGIVPVYEVGEDRETKRVYYTMRFLGKQTLQDSVREYHERREAGDHDPLLLRNLLAAFVSVCQAVGHAHSRKVIHRDLKPENVAIDNFGQVIVIDWGLAKILDETGLSDHPADGGPGGAETERTVAGQVFGTPLYMAPEQAAGRIDEVDERTDVYGLGAVLFAILTGVAPHEKSMADAANSGVRGLIAAITSKPTPLATDANPAADPALSAVCAKAMAKRRYARYQSATALAEDVQRWMAGEPVSAYTETRSQRLGRWVQQHRRTSWAIGTALTVALVAGVVVATTSYHTRGAARVSRFEVMKGDARGIDNQFATYGERLTRSVRFMANVPPVNGIMAARTATQKAPGPSLESEETWRPRLELIYEGLLRSNRDYLSVAYLSAETGTVTDLVRVERHTTDPSFIRKVPKGRHVQQIRDSFLDSVKALGPGEVRLGVADSSEATGPGRAGSRPRVIGAVPVYDEAKGTVFGLVVIEADVVVEAERILNTHAGSGAEMYVTSGAGQVWASSRPGSGVKAEPWGTGITTFLPGAADFFAADRTDPALVAPDAGVLANRIRLDPLDPASTVGVVLKLAE
jgi:serine/threonine protein kinase